MAISGSRPRNTTRHPIDSPTTPAIAGPRTPGSTHAVDRVANICGRSRSGMLRPIATYAMGGTVPAPRPWMKRPPTSTSIEDARPPTTRPIANRAIPTAKGAARPRRSMSPPTITIPINAPSMNDVNTQPYSCKLPSSSATSGRIVDTARASNATRVTVRTRPTVRFRRAGDHRPPPSSAGPGARWRCVSDMVQVCHRRRLGTRRWLVGRRCRTISASCPPCTGH